MKAVLQAIKNWLFKPRVRRSMATLTFALPDDEWDLKVAMNGSEFHLALCKIDEACRGWLKYGHEFEEVADALQAVRDMIPQEIHE